MANTATLAGVDIADVLPGAVHQRTRTEALGGALNEALRDCGCGSVVHQQILPDSVTAGLAQHTGAAQTIFSYPAAVPTLSTAHTQVATRIRVTVTGLGSATITWASVSAGATVVHVQGAAGPLDLDGLLTVDTTIDYEQVTLTVATDVGTTCTIHGFRLKVEPVATPIPSGTAFGDAQAFGITSLGPDYVHDAGLNDAIVDACEHCRDRPRALWGWVGIDPVVGGEGAMESRVFKTWAPMHRGALADGVVYRVVAYVTGTGPGAVVYLQTGDPTTWPVPDKPIPATVDGWIDATFPVPASTPSAMRMPVPGTQFGIWPWDGGNATPGRTDVYVRSILVFGA